MRLLGLGLADEYAKRDPSSQGPLSTHKDIHIPMGRNSEIGGPIPVIAATVSPPNPSGLLDIQPESPNGTSESRSIFRAFIDKVTEREIMGWIMNCEKPLHRCDVLLKEGDRVLTRTTASEFRHDLLSAGIGDGCYSFVLQPPRSLSDGQEYLLNVVEEETGTQVTTTPIQWRRHAATAFKVSTSISNTEFVDRQAPLAEARLGTGHPVSVADRTSSVELRMGRATDIVRIIQDVVSQIRTRANLSTCAETPQQGTISWAKVYAQTDAEAVFYCYKTILGCAPKRSDFRRLLNTLKRGAIDRRRLVGLLQREPKALRVHFIEDAPQSIPEVSNTEINDERICYSVNEFLTTASADEFLTHAYRTILKCDPNPRERAAYRDSMAGGLSHKQVLLALLGSSELKTQREPVAIVGVTPDGELLQLLFSMIEQLSQTDMAHEYELCLIRDRLEGI